MAMPKLAQATRWTKERISALSAPEVRQLRSNAERLQEGAVAALCDEVLGERRKAAAPRSAKAAAAGSAR